MTSKDLEEALEMGMDWSLREGYVWAEDKEHCEEYGRMLQADPSKVSSRAKKRGLPQVLILLFIIMVFCILNNTTLFFFVVGNSWGRKSLRRNSGCIRNL